MKNKKYKITSSDLKKRVFEKINFEEEVEFSKEFIDLIDPYFGRLHNIGAFEQYEKFKK